jgi:heme-degrading monooxygenase HmoA
MIVRIVQMTFHKELVDQFVELFEARKQAIRGFRGCTHLELWQDSVHENVFFTYSNWDSEADLNHYRFSEFFKDTWGKTKALFADKPQAWSVIKKSVA